MAAGWRDDSGTRAVLGEADHLHLAVHTSRGIHVTPTVFSMEAGELWLVVPRRSVKALAVRRHPTVGVLVRAGDRSLVLSGRARPVDPLTGRGFSSPGRILKMPLAAAGYLDRNHRHAAGVVRGRPVPTLPLSRMAISIGVHLAALVEDEDIRTWGPWPRRGLLLAGPIPGPARPDARDVPPRPAALLAEDGAAVLGWPSCAGPMALPARWEAASSTALVTPALMALAGCWTGGPGSLTLDRIGHGLDDKFGVMLAGAGAARLDGTAARTAVASERVTWWTGDHSGTVNRRTA
jgi:hypothetical protein